MTKFDKEILDVQLACLNTNVESIYVVTKCFTSCYLKKLQEVFVLKIGD